MRWTCLSLCCPVSVCRFLTFQSVHRFLICLCVCLLLPHSSVCLPLPHLSVCLSAAFSSVCLFLRLSAVLNSCCLLVSSDVPPLAFPYVDQRLPTLCPSLSSVCLPDSLPFFYRLPASFGCSSSILLCSSVRPSFLCLSFSLPGACLSPLSHCLSLSVYPQLPCSGCRSSE